MSKIKRLRIFAGPNGSGKSTLFEIFQRNFNPGIFINSDVIEKEILEKGFLDLQPFGLQLQQEDLLLFLQKPDLRCAKSPTLSLNLSLSAAQSL